MTFPPKVTALSDWPEAQAAVSVPPDPACPTDYLSDAYPDGERARWLRSQMDRRLLSSLLYLIEVAGRGLGEAYRESEETVRRAAGHLTGSAGKLRSGIYGVHSHLYNSLRAGDAATVDAILYSLPECTFVSNGILTRGFPRVSDSLEGECLVTTLRDEHNRTYPTPFDLSPPDPARLQAMDGVVSETLARIADTDPATHGELLSLVSDVVIMDSKVTNAGTSFPIYGCIYLRTMRPNQNWTSYLENLVHEGAHHYLFAVMSVDPIIQNEGAGLFKSPLRKEPRPLSAIYHQMFVLGRTIRAIRLFQRSGRYDSDLASMSTNYNNAGNPDPLEKKFETAAEVIAGHAKLSPVGRAIFESSIQFVQA